jgi:hypothetical protein
MKVETYERDGQQFARIECEVSVNLPQCPKCGMNLTDLIPGYEHLCVVPLEGPPK